MQFTQKNDLYKNYLKTDMMERLKKITSVESALMYKNVDFDLDTLEFLKVNNIVLYTHFCSMNDKIVLVYGTHHEGYTNFIYQNNFQVDETTK